MPIAPDVLRARSELGGYVRRGNAAGADQARRALDLAKTEDRIRRAIESAPPLDAETLSRIRALIPAVSTD